MSLKAVGFMVETMQQYAENFFVYKYLHMYSKSLIIRTGWAQTTAGLFEYT